MRKLLIATHSKGKFPEIVHGLSGLPFEFANLNDFGFPPGDVVEETASSFEGNAIIKAMYIGNKTGTLTLAEDAGLEVDALDGRPGVYSARFAPGTDRDRYMKILEELESVPQEKRTARFRAVLCVYDPNNGKLRTCEGVYEGRILSSPRGEGGFGYDPIFWGAELGKTSAEVSLEEKNAVSHRGKALKKMREILKTEFS